VKHVYENSSLNEVFVIAQYTSNLGPQWFGEEEAENNNVTQIADFFIFKTL